MMKHVYEALSSDAGLTTTVTSTYHSNQFTANKNTSHKQTKKNEIDHIIIHGCNCCGNITTCTTMDLLNSNCCQVSPDQPKGFHGSVAMNYVCKGCNVFGDFNQTYVAGYGTPTIQRMGCHVRWNKGLWLWRFQCGGRGGRRNQVPLPLR